MPVSSYPRTAVQGSTNANNPQNGVGLMLYNNSTQQYEAATSATFGGGGGGDATSANQSIQISEAQSTNTYLSDIQLNTTGVATSANQSTQITEAQSANTYLGDVANYLYDANTSSSAASLLGLIQANTFESNANRSIAELLYSTSAGQTAASLLNDIKTTLGLINTELQAINTNLTNGNQSTQITQGGNVANVNGSNQLEVKSN